MFPCLVALAVLARPPGGAGDDRPLFSWGVRLAGGGAAPLAGSTSPGGFELALAADAGQRVSSSPVFLSGLLEARTGAFKRGALAGGVLVELRHDSSFDVGLAGGAGWLAGASLSRAQWFAQLNLGLRQVLVDESFSPAALVSVGYRRTVEARPEQELFVRVELGGYFVALAMAAVRGMHSD